ncbi:DegT/DnrJ/EryC1/StrS aminotransferase family protein [Halobacteriovorax sp. HLS]|uniref:DegT/DnrJ/EryC1/StrS family aminotransferase n=1 Tax=Halobacteriovorax sp. HLS TaxID=2234000 RepID=UPI000FDC0A1A|nr:DegT/DnrJ/EryC1/StrS family aminotransferase [Halobacteriovorax sp. HLS]
MIPYENLKLSNQEFFNEYKVQFEEFISSGQYILGTKVEKFEEEFAKYNGNSHCVGVASGLDALTLSLMALELEEGSEVLVPSNTYIATILSIRNQNLVPVLIEPDLSTYQIDPTKIEERITKKTKAIIIVHLYGHACDMNPILSLCKKYDLKLIEDTAQAHGTKYNNQKAGSFGDMGAFSFYPTKNLGALGDAGAITLNNINYCNKIKALRNYGSHKKYYNDFTGVNSRLDPLQAIFLSIKLKKLDQIIDHKRNLATIYNKNLNSDFIRLEEDPKYHHSYHIYPIRHEKRDQLKEYLEKNGVKTEIHYPLAPHRQKCMQGILEGEYPIADKIHSTILSLPISYCHTETDIEEVVKIINKF